MSDKIDPQDYYNFPEAFNEGWAISQARGNADGTTWRIESMDEVDLFPGRDPQAHSFVFWNAAAGRDNALSALSFLLNHEPYELQQVFAHAGVSMEDGVYHLLNAYGKKVQRHTDELRKMAGPLQQGDIDRLDSELRDGFRQTCEEFMAAQAAAQPAL